MASIIKRKSEILSISYINKVNSMITDATQSLTSVIRTSEGPLFNNAAQAWNHDFFWKVKSLLPLLVNDS